MTSQIAARPVPRAIMERHMERVQEAIENGEIRRPQEMYDPGLVHPYGSHPPSGRAVLADLEHLYGALKKHPETTCDALAEAMKAESGTFKRQGTLFAAGAAVLAVGAAAAALWLPGAGAWATAAVSGLAGAGSAAAAVSRFRQGAEAERDATLVQGWQDNIREPQGLYPIPVSDAVNFEYVRYVEGIMIGQRRRAVGP